MHLEEKERLQHSGHKNTILSGLLSDTTTATVWLRLAEQEQDLSRL